MIEITNKTDGPLQILVRSRRKPRSFTTLVVPGRGQGKNVKIIEDELHTPYIDRVEKLKLISTRIVEQQRENDNR